MEGVYPWVPKGITRKNPRVWVGLGLCLDSMGIFGLVPKKAFHFGYFWVSNQIGSFMFHKRDKDTSESDDEHKRPSGRK